MLGPFVYKTTICPDKIFVWQLHPSLVPRLLPSLGTRLVTSCIKWYSSCDTFKPSFSCSAKIWIIDCCRNPSLQLKIAWKFDLIEFEILPGASPKIPLQFLHKAGQHRGLPYPCSQTLHICTKCHSANNKHCEQDQCTWWLLRIVDGQLLPPLDKGSPELCAISGELFSLVPRLVRKVREKSLVSTVCTCT